MSQIERAYWFAVERPTDTGTVFVRPEPATEPQGGYRPHPPRCRCEVCALIEMSDDGHSHRPRCECPYCTDLVIADDGPETDDTYLSEGERP